VIEKKGNSFNFREVKLGVGREAAKATLKADKKLIKEIAKEIIVKVKEKEALDNA